MSFQCMSNISWMLWIMLVINEVTQKGGNRETHQVSSLSLSRGVTSTHWPSATQGRHRVVTEIETWRSPWHACTVSTCLSTLCRLTVYEAAILKNLLTPELTCVTQQVNYAIRKPYTNQGYILQYMIEKSSNYYKHLLLYLVRLA